jgi:transposase
VGSARPAPAGTGSLRTREDHDIPRRPAIRAAGARLFFLPPYSPDLNLIEQVFAKLKHFLRKAAERTAPATRRRIGTLLDAFSPDECANYFVNSGCASV